MSMITRDLEADPVLHDLEQLTVIVNAYNGEQIA
jgi:hypothetical protein